MDAIQKAEDISNKNPQTNVCSLSCLGAQHEVEVCGENNLQDLYSNCSKNPGHLNFIPIDTFNMKHMPEGYHDTDLFDAIKAVAALTARLCVEMVSPKRPEFWPGTVDPYPLHNQGENKESRTATGQLTVYKFVKGIGYDALGRTRSVLTGRAYERLDKTCPCRPCQATEKPSSVWYEIDLQTACHVVFDDIEASHTIGRLFFDRQDTSTPPTILDTFKIVHNSVDTDVSVLKSINCAELGERLYEYNKLSCQLWGKVRGKYRNKPDVKLTFIVSHPHGCTKRVSFGQWVENCKLKDHNDSYDLTRLTYTTATCPGSSGAKIYCVGYDPNHFHCGRLGSGLNYSAAGLFSKT